MGLMGLPEKKRTEEWIKSEIKYERAPGVHTYHMCKCGRKGTRSGKCDLCWEEILEELRCQKENGITA